MPGIGQAAGVRYPRRGVRSAALVDFSGEVNEKESGPDPFTENSRTLNPNLNAYQKTDALLDAIGVESRGAN
jgi:hypothetical protein